MDIVGILLAAGKAERFGAPKLLQPLPDGVPVGVAAARTLIQAVPEAYAIVRRGDHDLKRALSTTGLTIIENPLADAGMGTSLAAGVRAAARAGGWLIALADMPWMHPATVCLLADSLRAGASMVVPAYRGRQGHPVGFSQRWGGQLQALQGDEGARRLIAGHTDQLLVQTTEDAGVVRDIDRPQDLRRDHRE
jgi:molybdenum cofactor cytidylyltransferase